MNSVGCILCYLIFIPMSCKFLTPVFSCVFDICARDICVADMGDPGMSIIPSNVVLIIPVGWSVAYMWTMM